MVGRGRFWSRGTARSAHFLEMRPIALIRVQGVLGGGRYISHHVCVSQLAWKRPPRPPRWKSTGVPRSPPPCPAPARPRPLPGLRASPLPARRPPLPPVRGCLLRGAGWGQAPCGAAGTQASPVAARTRPRSAQSGSVRICPPPEQQPPKTTPRPQSLPTAAATRVVDKREPEGAGALPRCFPGTTDAREPAPGGRVGGQIREAAGWGG